MNMSIEREFIPYEQALALKELGFNEGCFSLYFNNGEFSNFIHSFTVNSEVVEKTSSIPAPTFSQAFRWFREKYGLFATIDGLEERLYYKITQTNEYSKEYNTYEEAELECLNKLIEVVKNK